MALPEIQEREQLRFERERYNNRTEYEEYQLKDPKFSAPNIHLFTEGESSSRNQSIVFNYETHSFQGEQSTSQRKDTPIDAPELEGIEMHNPALTLRTRALVRIFWSIIVSKALQTSFPIEKTIVTVFKDPIEGRRQVVLKTFTEANASQAIAFWRGLESDFQSWISRLDEKSRENFLKNISLRIHWRERGNK
jgi:hypothetical protein